MSEPTAMPYNETAVIGECQRGDFSRFSLLYDAHIRRIYNFIYYKTHHKETAEDLTSDTFVKALTRIGQFTPGRAFSSWLYGIAQNAVIDYYRAKKPGVSIDDVWDLHSNEDIARDADIKMKLESVREHLALLPSRERDVVIMRVWQEMSYKEIAEVLGTSEANSKMIMSRALKKLKASMPLALFLALLAGTTH
jgi:RNA polymerase sigma-70 factor (ECF subfamily)